MRNAWEASRLYDAPAAFTSGRGFLLDVRPRVLRLHTVQSLSLDGLGSVGPPQDFASLSGRPSIRLPAKAFNPSIAHAPRDLCPLCAYIISLRVDTLHQCDTESSPYTRTAAGRRVLPDSFRGTAIGLLDSRLRLLRWTWLMNSPRHQIASSAINSTTARRAGCALPNASDVFEPVWAKQTFDARLLNYQGDIMVTYACPSCVFSVSPLRITGDVTADGGIHRLRVWAFDRLTYERWPWLAGRNQALFVHHTGRDAQERSVAERGRRSHGNASLWVQSRFGVVGLLGFPRIESQGTLRCDKGAHQLPVHRPKPDNCFGNSNALACGTSPLSTELPHHAVRGIEGRGAKLRTNGTAALRRAMHVAGAYGGLSLTSNLVHVTEREGGCAFYLGVGHLHRGEGELNRMKYRRRYKPAPWERWGPSSRGTRLLKRQPFKFGYRYSHFFYALAASPPFETVAASGEFCIGLPQDVKDCESVQFISGLTRDRSPEGGTLLLSYGVNDCEARLGTMPLRDAVAMLHPLQLEDERSRMWQRCFDHSSRHRA